MSMRNKSLTAGLMAISVLSLSSCTVYFDPDQESIYSSDDSSPAPEYKTPLPPPGFEESSPNQNSVTIDAPGETDNLATRWGQWVSQIPSELSPMDDPTGVNCAQDQSDDVWFFTGAGDMRTVQRTCTVPSTVRILAPIMSYTCKFDKDGPLEPASVVSDECYPDAQNLYATLDGEPLDIFLYGSENYYSTPNAAEGNRGEFCTCHASVTTGYWVGLSPLSPGEHTLNLGSLDRGYERDITYTITVNS